MIRTALFSGALMTLKDSENTPTVQFLGPDDMSEVMELERQCFKYHWTEEQFRLGLEKGAFRILGAGRDKHGKLVGYLAFSAVVDEMEILNLAVLPEYRRGGYGAKLMAVLLAFCRKNGIRKGFLDVKTSNTPAIDLYLKFGFKKIGVRKRYYPDTGEDALLLKREIV